MGSGASHMPTGPAVWKAAREGNSKALHEFLQHREGSKYLNWNNNERGGLTPLMIATRKGHYQVIQQLLEAGADINARAGNDAYTALHHAALKNNVIAITLLLSRGCNPHVWNSKGQTALDTARIHGKKISAKALQEHLVLKKGWLMYRRKKGFIAAWRKYWAVLLRCSADDDEYELALYRDKSSFRTEKVLFIRATDGAAAEVVKKKLWSDRKYMLCCQNVRFCYRNDILFSRSRHSRQCQYLKQDFTFAAVDIIEVHQWIKALNKQGQGNQHSPDIHRRRDTRKVVRQISSPGGPVQNATINLQLEIADEDARCEDEEKHLCIICMNTKKNSVAVPCGHISSCYNCLTELQVSTGCPICRQKIASVVRIYDC